MCGFYFSENRLSELTYEQQQQQQHEVYTQNAAEHGSGIDSNIVLHAHTHIYILYYGADRRQRIAFFPRFVFRFKRVYCRRYRRCRCYVSPRTKQFACVATIASLSECLCRDYTALLSSHTNSRTHTQQADRKKEKETNG